MKKVILLVVVFLIGSSTQAFSQRNHNVVTKQGKKHRYYNSQEIRFVENGVLYSVSTDGTFDFEISNDSYFYNWDRRNHNVVYYPGTPGAVQYKRGRRMYRPNISLDRFGRVRSVGSTYITYKRNGKVRSIGSVTLKYQRGRLKQVGNMHIVYNRFGEIRDTHGYVNRYNKKYWHDDWYIHYEYDCEQEDVFEEWGNRKRKRNI